MLLLLSLTHATACCESSSCSHQALRAAAALTNSKQSHAIGACLSHVIHEVPATAPLPLPPCHCPPATAPLPLPPCHCPPATAPLPLPPCHCPPACPPATAPLPLPPCHCPPASMSHQGAMEHRIQQQKAVSRSRSSSRQYQAGSRQYQAGSRQEHSSSRQYQEANAAARTPMGDTNCRLQLKPLT